MILHELASWSGAVEINGVKFDNVSEAIHSTLDSVKDIHSIRLYSNKESVVQRTESVRNSISDVCEYVITVKQYMTKKSTPDFDFMAKWNNDIPMPLRTMVGTVEKETAGMVYMKLHGAIVSETVQTCMRCGKPITNPVSQFFGMGPECGGHNYVNPFESDEELRQVVDSYRKNHLQKITWEGWVIRSAIIEKEIVAALDKQPKL